MELVGRKGVLTGVVSILVVPTVPEWGREVLGIWEGAA